MDDAEAGHLNSATSANAKRWCVGGRGGRDADSRVNAVEAASSADLGGSSKYSNENFED